MEVRFLTCRFGRSHVHNEFGEPLRRHPRISPSPRRSGVMRGQRREGRNPSVEPERRSCWLRWQPNPPTNSSEEPILKSFRISSSRLFHNCPFLKSAVSKFDHLFCKLTQSAQNIFKVTNIYTENRSCEFPLLVPTYSACLFHYFCIHLIRVPGC